VKIADVSVFPVRLETGRSYLGAPPEGAAQDRYFVRAPWRSWYSAAFESLLVAIRTDDGLEGWGEALAPVGPQVPAAVVERLLAPALIGEDPRSVQPIWQRLSWLMRERGHLVGHQADALAAVDIALWDLWGKVAGQPVAALLGSAGTRTVPTYVSGLPRPDDEGRAELMREWAAQGVRRVKLALGYGVEADLATFDAVAAVHDDLKVAIDAHWVYPLSDAQRLGRALDERKASWFLEAPLVPEDITGHRELAASMATPVAVGEALRNRYEFADWMTRRALDLAQPDVARTGITEARVIAATASSLHVPVAPHHSVGLGVALAAGLHLAAAVDNLTAFEFQPDTLPMANQILRTPIQGGPGEFTVPDGPGLGIEVDRDAVEKAVAR
jgi:D-galactarolactone cycloisomerase